MIARARAIAHGNAYTTYATLKENAQFICCENMAGDMNNTVTEDDLNFLWTQFKYAGENYIAKGKEVTHNLVAMEVSPTKEESRGWTQDDWNLFAHRVIEEMDKVEFRNKEGKVSSKKTDFAHSKWLAMLHTDAKSGIPHLHFMISRFTIDGRINDTNLIGLKATMAANSINQSMGWKQSKEISGEHKAEIKDALYDILRSMDRFDWDVFAREVKRHGYGFNLRKDNNNKVVGYRIQRGNSKYNASEIGRQLTAGRIMATCKQLHRDMEADAARIKAEEAKRTKAEYEARHHFICEPSRPNTNKVHYEFDRSFEKDKEPEHFTFDVSERIVDGMMDVFRGMVDEFEFVLEEVMEVTLFTFFEVMSVPGSSYSCSSGGGGNNDLPRKKNDEDEEWLRAKQIAKAVARSCPRKVQRGYRR